MSTFLQIVHSKVLKNETQRSVSETRLKFHGEKKLCICSRHTI